jgi:hypothetical protein
MEPQSKFTKPSSNSKSVYSNLENTGIEIRGIGALILGQRTVGCIKGFYIKAI